jgi:hypothetical protein
VLHQPRVAAVLLAAVNTRKLGHLSGASAHLNIPPPPQMPPNDLFDNPFVRAARAQMTSTQLDDLAREGDYLWSTLEDSIAAAEAHLAAEEEFQNK